MEVNMLKHIFKGLAALIIVMLVVVFTAVPVLAADFRSGATITVASGEVIDDDLYVAGSRIIIDGTINGDLLAAGETITINGTVNGNVMAAGETVNINGEVDVQPGAQIGGTTTHNLPEVKEPDKPSPFSGIVGKVLGFLMALVIGIIIVLVAPRRTTSIADSIRNRPWPSLGWGALILFVTPIVAIVVCITVIGIPLALISLALYGIAIYLSQIPVALLIGRWIIGYFREVETKAILVGTLTSGLVILSLLRLIPYLGFAIGLLTIIFGLGALLVSERRLRVEATGVTST